MIPHLSSLGRVPRPVTVGLLVVVLLIGRPVRAEGSFVAMLAYVIEAVNVSIDTWEKHTRMIEDHLDYVGGLTQSFSDVNDVFRTVVNNRGLRNRFRILDIARSEWYAPNCFRATWVPCTLLREYETEWRRQLPWRIGPGLSFVTQDYSEWEHLVRDGWDGVARLPTQAPANAIFSFNDMLDDDGLRADYERAAERTQARYHRGRRIARVKQADISAGREAAREFLYHDEGEAGGYAPLRPPGNMVVCPGDTATTLLGQAYLADCEDPDPAMPLARIIRGGLDSDTSGVWKVAGAGLRWT